MKRGKKNRLPLLKSVERRLKNNEIRRKKQQRLD